MVESYGNFMFKLFEEPLCYVPECYPLSLSHQEFTRVPICLRFSTLVIVSVSYNIYPNDGKVVLTSLSL
jgi:hypothetical protein